MNLVWPLACFILINFSVTCIGLALTILKRRITYELEVAFGGRVEILKKRNRYGESQ